MATQELYTINGVIDTDENIWTNIQKIGFACAIWPTFNDKTGKWEIVINQAQTPVFEITKDHIIGSLSLVQKPTSEMFNKVQINFPFKDIADERNFVRYEIDSNALELNEFPNELTLETDLINDPVQAQYVAAVELNQSRQRLIVEFTTDFTTIELTAGDVIEITYPEYEFDTKQFRIVSIAEIDDDANNILLNYTCIEYDPAIYSGYPLSRYTQTRAAGIKPKKINTKIEEKEDTKYSNDVNELFTQGSTKNTVIKSGSNGFIPELARRKVTLSGPSSICEGDTFIIVVTVPNDCCVSTPFTIPYTITGIDAADLTSGSITGNVTITNGSGSVSFTTSKDLQTEGLETLDFNCGCATHSVNIKDQWRANPEVTLSASATTVNECSSVTFTVTATNLDDGDPVYWEITGVDASDIQGGDLTGQITANWCSSSGTQTISFTKGGTENEGSDTLTFTLIDYAKSVTVTITEAASYTAAWVPSTITEGETATATLTTDGLPDNTVVPYTLSGSASSKVTSPALTGTVTVINGSATLPIATSDDSIDDGVSTTLTVQFGPVAGYATCNQVSGQLTVLDNDDAPEPPADPTVCVYTSVPAVWCGEYDGDTGQLQALTVKKYVNVLTYPAIGTGVDIPTAVSVTEGNPSTITVTSTVTAYPGYSGSASDYFTPTGASGIGGSMFHLITSFDDCAPTTPPTGTVTTFIGY